MTSHRKKENPPILICYECRRPMDLSCDTAGDCKATSSACLQVLAMPQGRYDRSELRPRAHATGVGFEPVARSPRAFRLALAGPVTWVRLGRWLCCPLDLFGRRNLAAQRCSNLRSISRGMADINLSPAAHPSGSLNADGSHKLPSEECPPVHAGGTHATSTSSDRCPPVYISANSRRRLTRSAAISLVHGSTNVKAAATELAAARVFNARQRA